MNKLKYIFDGVKGITKAQIPSYQTTEKIINDRLDICNKCEFRKNNKCSICGCYISQKVKLKNEECPKNKW